VKGGTYNFRPNSEIFHVTEVHDENVDPRSPEDFSLESFNEDFSLESFNNVIGPKVKITFSDGEVMYGTIRGYTPHMKGFFIFPADKESNNQRAFVIRESTVAVETFS
jgi:hypothetical protein